MGFAAQPKWACLWQVDEGVVRLMLPYLLHGVDADSQSRGVSSDYRTASHMILVQLCSIATLARDFLEGDTTPSLAHGPFWKNPG